MEEKKSLLDSVKAVWMDHRAKITAFVGALLAAVVNYFIG